MANADHLPTYLVVQRPHMAASDAAPKSVDAKSLQSLTSRIMQWNDDTWILDLSLCASYWKARALAQGTTAVALIREILGAFDSGQARAAFAEHPWQALLLVAYMRERRLSGLVLGQGPLGESMLRDISWEAWWACAEVLARHLEAGELRQRFQVAVFRRQCAQMRRAALRLGWQTPGQLKNIPAPAIQRRFGVTLRDMQQWAYGNHGGTTAPLFATTASGSDRLFETGFPWQSCVFTSLPCIIRHLETPLCEWAHLEALLREDFDRLCGLSTWLAEERVVSLEWRLILADLSYLDIPIRFRHPHSLHLERGRHATALLQALYSFEATRRQHGATRSESEHDLVVIGWELVIKERLTLSPVSAGLFDDAAHAASKGADSATEMAILHLENKLPIPLQAYALRDEWGAEDSYGPRGREPKRDEDALRRSSAHYHALALIAEKRPLYLYKKPVPYQPKERSSLWRFSERTMAKWWSRAERAMQRDYYRLTNHEQQDLWVYKSERGQWYVHGLYA